MKSNNYIGVIIITNCIRRRQVLRGIGVGSIGTTFIGKTGATSSNESPESSISNVDVQEITGRELRALQRQAMAHSGVPRLLRVAVRAGWQIQPDSVKAKRTRIQSEFSSGSFDSIAYKLAKRRGRRIGQDRSGEADDREKMFLQWVGNDSFGVDEHIPRSSTGGALMYLKNNPDSEKVYSGFTGPVSDEITIYEVQDGTVQSETARAANTSSAREDGVSTLSSGPYCEIEVDVYEGDPSTPCLDMWCIATSGLGGAVTAAGCLATGGLLCLAGGGVTLTSFVSCIACDKEFTTRVDIDRNWLENKSYRDDSCAEYGNNPRNNLVVTECEFYDLPTRQDYSSPDC